jgi:hypothetical protein
MRTDIDHGVLHQLQRDHRALEAQISGLLDEQHDTQTARAQANFAAVAEIQRYVDRVRPDEPVSVDDAMRWTPLRCRRLGVNPEPLLTLRRFTADLDEIRARIKALRSESVPLGQLLKACEQYANGDVRFMSGGKAPPRPASDPSQPIDAALAACGKRR